MEPQPQSHNDLKVHRSRLCPPPSAQAQSSTSPAYQYHSSMLVLPKLSWKAGSMIHERPQATWQSRLFAPGLRFLVFPSACDEPPAFFHCFLAILRAV